MDKNLKMRIRGGRKLKEGMALMEVVMATGIMAIMAAALIGSFSYGFYIVELVRENQRATQILIEKAETIRLYSWTQVNTTGFIPSSFSDYFDPQAAQGSKGVTYHGSISVGNVPFSTSYSANMKQIQVTVVWTSSRNLTHTRQTATYIAKDGIQNYVY